MTRALVTRMLRALDASRDDVNECINEILPKAGSYRYDRVIGSLTTKLTKHDAAITSAREYLATEPSGERADSAQWLREFADMEFGYYSREATQLRKAADMLEADAQQRSKPHGHCTHQKCREIWSAYLEATEKLSKYEPGATMHLNDAQQAKPTGWDNGLSQDYCAEFGQWLASRPGARQQIKEMFEPDAPK